MTKQKVCKKCSRLKFIFSRGMCKECAAKNPKKKKFGGGETVKSKEPTKTDLFDHIWATRPHVSEVSGKPLFEKGHKFWHWQFSHLLTGNYSKAVMNEENVVLMTWEEHQNWEFHAHKIRDKEEWQWVFNKREMLKQEYFE